MPDDAPQVSFEATESAFNAGWRAVEKEDRLADTVASLEDFSKEMKRHVDAISEAICDSLTASVEKTLRNQHFFRSGKGAEQVAKLVIKVRAKDEYKKRFYWPATKDAIELMKRCGRSALPPRHPRDMGVDKHELHLTNQQIAHEARPDPELESTLEAELEPKPESTLELAPKLSLPM